MLDEDVECGAIECEDVKALVERLQGVESVVTDLRAEVLALVDEKLSKVVEKQCRQ